MVFMQTSGIFQKQGKMSCALGTFTLDGILESETAETTTANQRIIAQSGGRGLDVKIRGVVTVTLTLKGVRSDLYAALKEAFDKKIRWDISFGSKAGAIENSGKGYTQFTQATLPPAVNFTGGEDTYDFVMTFEGTDEDIKEFNSEGNEV